MIPYGRQSINQDDIDAVVEVLRSEFLTQGPMVPRFESAIVAQCGGGVEAVAANSATSALHLACMALDVGPGDVVWTSPITFVASSNSALYCGADIDFVDVDPLTWNMSVEALATKLADAEVHGRLPKVVMPVHLCGHPCDMAAIGALAHRYGFKVVEDASHAIGGSYGGAPVGNCAYSDITVFSFHPVKIVTTAEGGVATTRDPALAERLRLFRSHGLTRNSDEMEWEPDGPWYYQQVALGYNYRMTELQAALGVSQMTRLDEFIARRRRLAALYDRLLEAVPVLKPHVLPNAQSAWHLYVVRVDAARRRAIFEAMRAADIGVNVHYIPVPSQPFYRRLGHDSAHYPNAQAYYAECISIPLYYGMTDQDAQAVVTALQRSL